MKFIIFLAERSGVEFKRVLEEISLWRHPLVGVSSMQACKSTLTLAQPILLHPSCSRSSSASGKSGQGGKGTGKLDSTHSVRGRRVLQLSSWQFDLI
eukprot:319698-Pelagomonas_calceolata.AAC.1